MKTIADLLTLLVVFSLGTVLFGCSALNYEREPVLKDVEMIEVRDVDSHISAGTRLDAICMVSEGRRMCASGVRDYSFLGGSSEYDAERVVEVLGEPDAQCHGGGLSNAVHLGHDGIVVVEFDEIVSLYEGDEVDVYVLTDNGSLCPFRKYMVYVIDRYGNRQYLCKSIRTETCKIRAIDR